MTQAVARRSPCVCRVRQAILHSPESDVRLVAADSRAVTFRSHLDPRSREIDHRTQSLFADGDRGCRLGSSRAHASRLREDRRRCQRLGRNRHRAADTAGAAITADGSAAAHQRSLGRLDGRPRAGNAGRRRSRRLHAGAVQGARAQAGQSRRHLSPERRPDRLQGASDGVVHGGRKDRRAQVSRRLHRQLAARPPGDEGRQLRRRLRRLRRRRAGIRLG